MSHIISNELYDLIINSNLEQELKDLLISSQSNNEDISDTSLIMVRALSFAEYNKYIINGTLDGTITKYDINAWHQPAKIEKTGWFSRGAGAMISSLSPGQTIYCDVNRTHTCKASGYIVTNDYVKNYEVAEHRYKTTIIPYTVLVDNNTNKYSAIGTDDYIFEAAGGRINYYDRAGNIGSCSISKMISPTKDTTRVSNSAVGLSRILADSQIVWNIYLDCSFRPVFQYKDNHKSTNIYL